MYKKALHRSNFLLYVLPSFAVEHGRRRSMDTFTIGLFDWNEIGIMTPVEKIGKHNATLKKVSIAYAEQRVFHRKFIVLIVKGGEHAHLAVGPIFQRNPKRMFYFHRDLLAAFQKHKSLDHLINGGGEICFYRKSVASWRATFGEYSQQFGVFDPSILRYRNEIARWIAMPIDFIWKESIRDPIKHKP